ADRGPHARPPARGRPHPPPGVGVLPDHREPRRRHRPLLQPGREQPRPPPHRPGGDAARVRAPAGRRIAPRGGGGAVPLPRLRRELRPGDRPDPRRDRTPGGGQPNPFRSIQPGRRRRSSTMTRVPLAGAAITAIAALAIAACGKAAPDSSTSQSTAAPSASDTLSPTTPAATGEAGKVTWATYRDVGTIDPIQALDYPDKTAIKT